MDEVVFMLQVKRSERGFESRPPSSFVSPDALLGVSVLALASPSLGTLRTNLEVILLMIPVEVPLRC